jgi:Kef-type K+ transport system membrane component KefB
MSGGVESTAGLLLALAVVLLAARVGGGAAERLGQPAVLGELLVGVLLGNLGGAAGTWLRTMRDSPGVELFAGVGAVVLLFEVGLESTLRDMLRVGPRSLAVAVVGVAVPWALGWWVGAALLPDRSVYVHAFIGATITATSVGITARVLRDLGRSSSAEARVILGAAVIDDVLGLVILAAVGSVVMAADHGQAVSLGSTALVLAKALAFLVAALLFGTLATPRLFDAAARLPGRGALLTSALGFCFLLAYGASAAGLAPIVGAYAAGLVLEEAHGAGFAERGDGRVEDLIRPVSLFMVPTFFVTMGMRVELDAMLRPDAIGLALMLTAAAVVGKQACALAGIGSGLDAITIGLGMIPRGEVGLIFANIGLSLTVHGERMVDAQTYAAVVAAVVLTTLLTPPLLKWRFTRSLASAPTAEFERVSAA